MMGSPYYSNFKTKVLDSNSFDSSRSHAACWVLLWGFESIKNLLSSKDRTRTYMGGSSFVEGFRAVGFEFDSPKETKEGTYNDYLGGKP